MCWFLTSYECAWMIDLLITDRSKYWIFNKFWVLSNTYLLQQGEWKMYPFLMKWYQFEKFFDSATPSTQECMKVIWRNKLESIFPNAKVAFWMYLCLPVTNCSAERVLRRWQVKNVFICLNENRKALLRWTDYEDIIADLFLQRQGRRHGAIPSLPHMSLFHST